MTNAALRTVNSLPEPWTIPLMEMMLGDLKDRQDLGEGTPRTSALIAGVSRAIELGKSWDPLTIDEFWKKHLATSGNMSPLRKPGSVAVGR